MIIIKENDKNKQVIEAYIKEIVEQCNTLEIPINKNIIIMTDTRSSRRLGCCQKLSDYSKTKYGLDGYDYQIKISELIFKSFKNEIRNTIAHEFLHTCENCMNHGKRWKYFANKLNNCYHYNIKTTTSLDKSNEAKYIVECPSCGKRVFRYKSCNVTQKPYLYICGNCGNKGLKLIKN